MTTNAAPGIINVQVIRGSAGFGDACRLAAAGLAMAACANAAVAAPSAQAEKAFDRPAIAASAATAQLNKMLPSQVAEAEKISPEQAQTLKYGIYPPVKTTVQINGKKQTHWTLHPFDLVRLAREASQQAAQIEGIKVDPARIGALMLAESSMVSRVGWSSNGSTPSFGLGQLEGNTAKALGVNNPNDPVEAAIAVARLLAQAQRFAQANRSVDERLAVSLAYNTSTALRKSLVAQYGANLTIDNLPAPTQHHVKNMAYGEQIMARFAKLSDQHDKAAPTLRQSTHPEEHSMNTSDTPKPTTKSLVAQLSTDTANRVRLEHNQAQLEKAGHLQPLPMTTKGLNDLRQAISSTVDSFNNSSAPKTMMLAALPAPISMALAAKDALGLAKSMVEKVAETYTDLRERMTAGAKDTDPSKSSTFATIQHANTTAASAMQMGQQVIQQVREKLAQQLQQQQRPV